MSKKARVALARKLGVILHRMWVAATASVLVKRGHVSFQAIN
jgi:hypothetical protein